MGIRARAPGARDDAPPACGGLRPVAEVVTPVDAGPYLAGLEERFGMSPASFDGYVVFRPSSRRLAIADRGLEVPEGLELLSIGIPFLYVAMARPRLTTTAAIHFGDLARRNVLELEPRELESFLLRREVRLRPEARRDLTGPGDVIVRQGAMVVGTGRAVERDGGLALEAMVPRSWPARLSLGSGPGPRRDAGRARVPSG